MLTGCSDLKDAYYQSQPSATEAGMFEKGWLPQFVPAFATEIYEVHDLDSGHGLIRFSLPAERLNNFLESVRTLAQPGALPDVFLRIRRKWWRGDLRGAVPAAKMEQLGYEMFAINVTWGDNQIRYGCAVSTQDATVYLWY